MALGLQHYPMAYNTLYDKADDAEALNQISALCSLNASRVLYSVTMPELLSLLLGLSALEESDSFLHFAFNSWIQSLVPNLSCFVAAELLRWGGGIWRGRLSSTRSWA